MVGGQDDQVFDGASFALNPGGKLAFQMPAFDAQIAHVDLEQTPEGWRVVEGEKSAGGQVLVDQHSKQMY